MTFTELESSALSCSHSPWGQLITELQIRRGIGDDSKIISLISEGKHMLQPLIRTVSARQF